MKVLQPLWNQRSPRTNNCLAKFQLFLFKSRPKILLSSEKISKYILLQWQFLFVLTYLFFHKIPGIKENGVGVGVGVGVGNMGRTPFQDKGKPWISKPNVLSDWISPGNEAISPQGGRRGRWNGERGNGLDISGIWTQPFGTPAQCSTEHETHCKQIMGRLMLIGTAIVWKINGKWCAVLLLGRIYHQVWQIKCPNHISAHCYLHKLKRSGNTACQYCSTLNLPTICVWNGLVSLGPLVVTLCWKE